MPELKPTTIRRATAARCAVVGALFALTACNGASDDSTNAPAQISSARAPSQQYVELLFTGQVSGPQLLAGSYEIKTESGATLSILGALPTADGYGVLLQTAPQEQIKYSVFGSPNLGIGSAGFEGSTRKEPFLESVIALSNRELLVTFSERMDPALAQNPGFYRISDPDTDLDVDISVLVGSPGTELEFAL